MTSRTALIVLVAALGYFVDVFDLVLFSVVRTQSLKDLGISGDGLLTEGVKLLNAQMFGMIVGGILWGVLGDKVGRVQALFGSILTYALANIANGFVTSVEQYEALRFISGVGLAGEIGGAITLVGEVLSKERRGIGMACVITAGALGAVVASYSTHLFHWRTTYYIGGGLGIVLLALRVAVSESTIFASIKSDDTVKRGSLTLLFTNRDRVARFMALVAIGAPYMFSWSIIATFSPEIAQGSSGFVGLSSAVPISFFAIGVTVGDIASSLLSQYVKSRRAVLSYFLCAQAACVFGLLHLNFGQSWIFYAWFLPIGFFGGLWAVLVTTASEQYGTNLRTTVTCMIPNFIRGTTVLLSWSFLALKSSVGIMSAVHIMTGLLTLVALLGIRTIRESFGIHLAFVEVRGGQRSHGQSGSAQPEESDVKQASGW
jgi:MFS transporter, putative metabolite:H+ symporter